MLLLLLLLLLQVPELLLVKKAVLAAFGCARTSAIVCDVGHSNCSVAAVQEGYLLQRLQQEIPLGCRQLLALTRQLLQQHHISITPGYAVIQQQQPGAAAHGDPAAAASGTQQQRQQQQQQADRMIAACPHGTKSFREVGEQHVLEVLLQLLGKCSTSSSSSSSNSCEGLKQADGTAAAAAAAAAAEPYVLPDGTQLPPAVCTAIETTVPEVFFSAALRQQHRSVLLPEAASSSSTAAAAAAGIVTAAQHQQQQQQQQEAAAATAGLLECISRCAEACKQSAKRDVLGALVLAGGGTQFPGFVRRLKAEVSSSSSSSSSRMQ